MDRQSDFRALLLKLQDCLSDSDRRRLHFLVGSVIPRHLRDDPTLGGTLSLLELLFDRAKISDQNFDYLIQVFSAIHCYEAVKRLKEHQQTQRASKESTSTLIDLVNDNLEDDKMHSISIQRNEISNCSKSTDNVRYASISSDQPVIIDGLTLPSPSSATYETEQHPAPLKLLKQLCNSHLTTCQLVLFFCNILAISILLVLIIIFVKNQARDIVKFLPNREILLVREGPFHGEITGGDRFDDAHELLLTFHDTLIGIKAAWSFDVLDEITFIYSNGKTVKHGGFGGRATQWSSQFYLRPGERISGVTVYTDIRHISNPYKPNGTNLVVGVRFYTSTDRASVLLGSSNGTETTETNSNYTLAYVRGRALGYIDGLQFIWYKQYMENGIATW